MGPIFHSSEFSFLTHALNFSKIANSRRVILFASCVTNDLWLQNERCADRAHHEMTYSIWLTFLCFCFLGRSFKGSISVCHLSLMMSRPKLMACFALLPQSTCSSSTGKTRHGLLSVRSILSFCVHSLLLEFLLLLVCRYWIVTEVLLRFIMFSCSLVKITQKIVLDSLCKDEICYFMYIVCT